LQNLTKEFEHIIYVPGNHEYYQSHGNLAQVESDIKFICDTLGIHFLQKDSWIHPNGIRFVGCTLWSDIDEKGCLQSNDFVHIFDKQQDYLLLHLNHKQWLQETLATSNKPTIVVTHHLPSFQGVAAKFQGENNTGYATNLESLFQFPVIGWICGHTHFPANIKINHIPLYINPIGYPGELLPRPFYAFECKIPPQDLATDQAQWCQTEPTENALEEANTSEAIIAIESNLSISDVHN